MRYCASFYPASSFVSRSWTRRFYGTHQSTSEPTQHQTKIQDNLSLIDFFDPALSSLPRTFTFLHGVSGYAKKNHEKTAVTQPQEETLYLSAQYGDDAYFRRNDALGVADGVGGWKTRSGANPALYSLKLMHYAQYEIGRIKSTLQQPGGYEKDIESSLIPVDILNTAYQHTTQDARLEDELRVANIGDCGVSVIRKDSIIFRSEEQQHSFNFPYQLGTASCDTPLDSQKFSLKVEEGDIIILGSDGLFDNLYDEEILEEVNKCMGRPIHSDSEDDELEEVCVESIKDAFLECSTPNKPDPQAISDALAFRAKGVSEDRDNPSSPFQLRAMDEGMYYQGGKPDDITVVVAVVDTKYTS
ncbi:phosphatase 2C-like domain-containing protein [Spinellus fusiger]|nr:phosphatase 2C-like domain-containing protein [Spinellus fusiger]